MAAGSIQQSMRVPGTHAKPHWRDFRETYPRISSCLAVGIALLLLANTFLVYRLFDLDRKQGALEESMARAEARQAELVDATDRNLSELAGVLARRQALSARELHLSVDCGRKVMYLHRDGAELRAMPIRVGPAATAGTGTETVRLAPPQGRRAIVAIVDESYRWEVPEWAFLRAGQEVPEERSIAGALGPVAILLEGGAVIYAQPARGPLSDPDTLLPGGIRAEVADLQAVRVNLRPGMAVYFY